MFTLDLTPEQCERVQRKLREILRQSPDPDISLLLELLEVSSRSRWKSSDTHLGKKRIAPDADDSGSDSRYPRKMKEVNRARNTRNDGRRRRHRAAVVRPTENTFRYVSVVEDRAESTIGTESHMHGRSITDVDRGCSLIYSQQGGIPPLVTPPFQPPLSTANQHYDFEDGSELSSLSSSGSDTMLSSDESEPRLESGAESDAQRESETNNVKPRRRAKARAPKPNSWEEVDNVLEITEAAANVLHSLAAVRDDANMSRLLVLKDQFSLQGAQIAEPATITLAYLVKRARSSDVGMVIQKFKHIVDLMQLSVWLDQ